MIARARSCSRARRVGSCAFHAADTAPSRAARSFYAALGASRLQPRRVFPHGTDRECNAGRGEAARYLRSTALRVLIQSTCELIAGAGVVLRMFERSVEVQQVDVGHRRTIAGREAAL